MFYAKNVQQSTVLETYITSQKIITINSDGEIHNSLKEEVCYVWCQLATIAW